MANLAVASTAPRWCYRLGKSLYVHLTSQCNSVSLVASRGPGFKTPWLPTVQDDPDVEQVLDDVRAELARVPAEALVFAGHGEPTMVLDVLLTAVRSFKGMGFPMRLNTNGLGSLQHGRNLIPDLQAAGVSGLSIALNAATPAEYKLLVKPDVHGNTADEAFDAACDFVRVGVEVFGAAQVEVTCVDFPGKNVVAAVEALASGLGAGSFRCRPYYCLQPPEGFPTHHAAFQGELSYFAALSDAALSAKDDRGNTPLIWAAEAGHAEIVRLLIDRGCPVDTPGMSGNTAVLRAVSRGRSSVLAVLLEARADANKYNDKQQTALHHAAFYQHPECVRQLLSVGADASLPDAKGRIPEADTASAQVREVFAIFGGSGEGIQK